MSPGEWPFHFLLGTPNMTILLLVLHFDTFSGGHFVLNRESFFFVWLRPPPKMRTLMYLYFFQNDPYYKILDAHLLGGLHFWFNFYATSRKKFFTTAFFRMNELFHEPDFWSDSISHMGVTYLPTAVNSLSTRLSFYPRLKHSDFWSDNNSALD